MGVVSKEWIRNALIVNELLMSNSSICICEVLVSHDYLMIH